MKLLASDGEAFEIMNKKETNHAQTCFDYLSAYSGSYLGLGNCCC